MKRILPLLVLASALAVPSVALAEEAPAPSAQTQTERPVRGKRHGKHPLRAAYRKCKRLEGAEQQQCLDRLVAKLEQVKTRLAALKVKVEARCAEDASRGDRCSRVLRRIERLEARVEKAIQRFRGTSTASESS